jgi:E3 ubiquitin-protein ligase BAH
LIFLVNSNSGIPIDACLSPETRAYLRSLAVKTQELAHYDDSVLENNELPEEGNKASKRVKSALHQVGDRASHEGGDASTQLEDADDYHRVEVPLRYDHEFFQMLKSGVLGLNNLQTDEKAELTKEIGSLGQEIAKIAAPSQNSARTDMYAWREVFSLYMDSQVFFSTSEQDKYTRDTRTAEKQLQHFSINLRALNVTQSFRREESYLALDRFLHLNLVLLRNLRFQELNTTAMTKILKSKW